MWCGYDIYIYVSVTWMQIDIVFNRNRFSVFAMFWSKKVKLPRPSWCRWPAPVGTIRSTPSAPCELCRAKRTKSATGTKFKIGFLKGFVGANWTWWIILVFLFTCILKREHGHLFFGEICCGVAVAGFRKAFGTSAPPLGGRLHLQSQRLPGQAVVPPAVSW